MLTAECRLCPTNLTIGVGTPARHGVYARHVAPSWPTPTYHQMEPSSITFSIN